MLSTPNAATQLHIMHDGPITIATGRNRKETDWKNREMLWSELVKRLSQTNRTKETYEEYKKLPKSEQDAIKDVGGFVGGTLKGGRRKTSAVVWRQIVTLDADYVKGDLWAAVETMLDCACVMYSTHKHSPESPRLRLVIPLSRPVTPDEYQAVSRRMAADVGIDFFDNTTYEPHRLMYWPSTSKDGEFVFRFQDAPWLDPDEVLRRYPDWRDPSYWPESSRTRQERKRLADKQGDPHEKPGIVGAFCRTYSISQAIETFLGDIYEPAGEGRYTYIPGSTVGGLVVYDGGKFAYSHHSTDPISGRLVNAFDLVRLHKFGVRDDEAEPGTPTVRLPSYTAMVELATADEQVRQTLGEERLADAAEEFGEMPQDNPEWVKHLKVNRRGEVLPTIDNILIILENDPRLANAFALNEFSHLPVIRKSVPWRKVQNGQDGEAWHDSDDAALRHYIETVYGINSPTKVNDALAIVMERNKFHPVRDYLGSLWWDGIPRIDTLLVDYLGAEDSLYVRAVTRKALTAAVARVFNPGCKFDYMLVLVGPQGIGKSHFIAKLGQRWYSDTLDLVAGKGAYEQLQNVWLIEMGELSAIKKAEIEAVKHFISKERDRFRVAYGRHVTEFPRQCVFFGTTNDREFLRDKTGNRRFWPVDVAVENRRKNLWHDMDQYEIDQIWAEAVDAWKNNEHLYLNPSLEAEAAERQTRHTEESPKAGVVREYLERLLPSDWDERDLNQRRAYLHGHEFGEEPEGTIRRDKVCVMEIWAELFEGDPKQLTQLHAREIHDILRQTPGWKPYTEGVGKLRFGKLYGVQKAYVREGFGKN